MDTIKFKKGSTLMVAHRGLSGLERENTNAAFIAAANRSYFGMETDIYRTADGAFVIMHNATTEFVAGENLNVEQSTLAQLQNLLLYDMDGTKSRADLRISTLSEYISICKRYEKAAVLELKSHFTAQEMAQIVSLITKQDYLDKVIFISFHLEVLKHLRKLCPQQPAQYLVCQYSDKLIDVLLENHLDLDIYFASLNEENIRKMHSYGIKINSWTVDSSADAERLAGWGVDFITSNILE